MAVAVLAFWVLGCRGRAPFIWARLFPVPHPFVCDAVVATAGQTEHQPVPSRAQPRFQLTQTDHGWPPFNKANPAACPGQGIGCRWRLCAGQRIHRLHPRPWSEDRAVLGVAGQWIRCLYCGQRARYSLLAFKPCFVDSGDPGSARFLPLHSVFAPHPLARPAAPVTPRSCPILSVPTATLSGL